MAPERPTGFNANQLRNVPNIATSIPSGLSPFPSSNTQSRNPPPVPSRQPTNHNQLNYSGLSDSRPFGSNYYGGYGYGYGNQYRGMNGFGGYNSYSPYPNYNNYGSFGGYNGNAENRFFQYVEENTRSTFQLIETVLQTFSSMTMLLESTYFALTNSFKAILSVAENVGRLRSTVNQLFSTFALIRFLKWLYRKIIRNTGFRNQDTMNEEIWDKSLAMIGSENVHTSSLWSGLLIFGVFFVVPYIIHKISKNIKNMEVKGKDMKEWRQCGEPIYVATVLYDFVASNNDELSIKVGQKVALAPLSLQPKNLSGWCIASDNINVGLIPYNYVKVVGQVKNEQKSNEMTPLSEDKLAANVNFNSIDKPTFTTASSGETVGKEV